MASASQSATSEKAGSEQEKAYLRELSGKPLFARLGGYVSLSGPGWLQSALTLGGGSLTGSLYLGVLAGFSMLWLQPLAMILQEPRGLPKLPFTRPEDPYGLIDAAALFEWVAAEEGKRVERIDDWARACRGTGGSVIVHREGGFVDLGATSDVAAEASRWRADERHLRVIRVVPLG